MAPDFDERQLKEIRLALVYLDEFHHGTDGHGRLMLIAHLARMCTHPQVVSVVVEHDDNKPPVME